MFSLPREAVGVGLSDLWCPWEGELELAHSHFASGLQGVSAARELFFNAFTA